MVSVLLMHMGESLLHLTHKKVPIPLPLRILSFSMLGWWMKAPYEPIKTIKRLRNMIAWDELHKYDEQILHIEVSENFN